MLRKRRVTEMAVEPGSWKTAAEAAAESGRDVVTLLLADEGNPEARTLDGAVRALQEAIPALDTRWKGGAGRPPRTVREACAFDELARGSRAVRLVSRGTADLFGATPATRAVAALTRLLADSADPERLRPWLERLPAGAVKAHAKLLASLRRLRSGVRLDLAAPDGSQSAAALTSEEIRTATDFLARTVEHRETVRVTGKLASLDAVRRTFRLETEDGRTYAGRAADEAVPDPAAAGRLALPVRAAAVIERRTVSRPALGTETVTYTLKELDTDLGLETADTLDRLRELYDRLTGALQDGTGEAGEGLPGMSPDDYERFAGLAGELMDSNPLKGARRALDQTDVCALYGLLAPGRPIARLAACRAQAGLGAEAVDDDPSLAAARRKAAGELARTAAAAFADYAALLKRLRRMIDVLEDKQAPDR